MTQLAVHRPVTTLMCALIIILVGLIAFFNMPADLLPDMSFPMVVVTTRYDGSGPQEIEALVSRPLEEVLGRVGNVKQVTSYSAEGNSIVMLEFAWGTNMDQAALDVREGVDMVKRFLPDDAEDPVVIKADPAMLPVMRLALSGPYDPVELSYSADYVKGRLERIDGVASVGISGQMREEVLVEVDPSRLLAYGIPLQSIISGLRSENLNLPGGHLEEASMRTLVRSVGEFIDLDDMAQTRIPTHAGAIALGELAWIHLTQSEPSSFTRLNAEPSVGLAVQKQSGANTVQVANAVRRELVGIEQDLPSGMSLVIADDQSEFINISIRTVVQNALLGSALAVAILYFFLSSWPVIFIIATAIPISVVATFAFMYATGITLNMVSLGGLALGVGMLVDNAIVVLENIFRHRSLGHGSKQAALQGAAEMAMPVTASTITTVVVFLPVIFIEGMASQIFRDLAYTISFSLLASLLVALTFIPMAASVLLQGRNRDGLSKSRLQPLTHSYRHLLAWALAHRGLVAFLTVLVLGGVIVAYPAVPTEFLPDMDRGEINIAVELPTGSSLAETDHIVRQIEEVVLTQPETHQVLASVGRIGGVFGGAGAGQDEATVTVVLKEGSSTPELVERLRQVVHTIPGAEYRVRPSAGFIGEEALLGEPVVIRVKGDDFEILDEMCQRIVEAISPVDGIREVRTSLETGAPETRILIDRTLSGHYGLSAAHIATTVRASLQGEVATRYRVAGSEIDVRVIYPEGELTHTHDLAHIMLLSPQGMAVPLSHVARLETGEGPSQIMRQGQVRTVTVTAQVVGRDLGSAAQEVRDIVDSLPFPAGYSREYGGETQEMMEAFSTLGEAMLLSVLLVYMVLAAQFESLLHPFIIMLAVPLAMTGSLYGLLLSMQRLSVPSIIGIIALGGIVVNNGIVLVDYTLRKQREGRDLYQAVQEAGTTRLRPILMTTLTTVLALIPMALGMGRGAELQVPLAVSIIGGLLLATLVNLVAVPVFYTLIGQREGRSESLASPEKGAQE